MILKAVLAVLAVLTLAGVVVIVGAIVMLARLLFGDPYEEEGEWGNIGAE